MPPDEPGLPKQLADKTDAKTGPERQNTPKPEFDLASLPSLNSITAVTDIRAFLSPGVPKELARAALRRAWSADPAIRDFIGLAENAWTSPIPRDAGFGALPAGYDVKKLVAQIFGESEKPVESQAAVAHRRPQALPYRRAKSCHRHLRRSPPCPQTDEDPSAEIPDQRTADAQDDMVQRDNNIASHNSISGGRDRRTQETPPAWRRIASVESRTHSLRLLTHCLVGRYLYIEII